MADLVVLYRIASLVTNHRTANNCTAKSNLLESLGLKFIRWYQITEGKSYFLLGKNVFQSEGFGKIETCCIAKGVFEFGL